MLCMVHEIYTGVVISWFLDLIPQIGQLDIKKKNALKSCGHNDDNKQLKRCRLSVCTALT